MGRLGHLGRGAMAALLVRGVEVGGKFALYFLAALTLGAEQSGFLFLCLTWVHVLSTVARAGLDRALIRHVSAELAVGRRAAARADILRGMGWTTTFAIVVAGGAGVLADRVAVDVFSMPDAAHALTFASLAIVAQTVNFMLCAVLVGLGRSVVAQALQNAWWPVGLLIALALGVHTAAMLMVALAVASLLAIAVGLRLLVTDWRRPAAGAASADAVETVHDLPVLWRTARPLALVEVVQVSISNLPTLVLAMVAGPAVVAAFSIASRMSQLVWVVLLSIATVAAPRIGAAHRRGEAAALRLLNRGMQGAGAAIAGGGAIVMMLAAPTLLGLVGQDYVPAAAALSVMALGQFVNAMFSGQDTMLAMTGHGWVLGRINVVQFALCVVGGVTLIPAFAMSGAAVVAALPVAVGAFLSATAVRHLMPQAAPVVPPGAGWVFGYLVGRSGRAATHDVRG